MKKTQNNDEKNQSKTSENKKLKENKPTDNRLSLNQLLKPLLFVIFSIFLEMLSFSDLKLGILPKYIFFDLGIFLILAGIIFIAHKNWLSNVFFFLFIAVQIFFNILNDTLLYATEDVFYFDLLSLTSEGVKGFDSSFVDFACVFKNLALLASAIVLVIILDTFGKKKRFETRKISKSIFLFIGFFVCWILGLTFYSCQVFQLSNSKNSSEISEFDADLYKNLDLKTISLKKFGTYGFLFKDFYNTYLKKIDYNSYKTSYAGYLQDGQNSVNDSSALYGENLIVICMESTDMVGLDPFNTPTLWNLCYGDNTASGSPITLSGSTIFMENFYAKNKTNISEGIGILGYAPDTTVIETEDTNSLSIQYALPKLFNELGYSTNYFHSYISSFYQRSTVNANYGFDNLYFIEDAETENMNTQAATFNYWISEVDYFNSMKERMILEDTPFFSFYMTVSAHGSYATDKYWSNWYSDTYDANLEEYVEWLSTNTNYIYPSDEETLSLFKNFKLGVMDLDAMVAEMITYLEEKNLMDSTTIVLYADHDCFYNSLSDKVKTPAEKYNIPFFIYNGSNKLESQIVSEFCSTYNVYPTICELFGLAYNANMCQGVSIFNSDLQVDTDALSSAVFYSTEGQIGFFDLYCQSNTLVSTEVTMIRENVTDEMVKNFLENARKLKEKQFKLNFIYKSNWTKSLLE